MTRFTSFLLGFILMGMSACSDSGSSQVVSESPDVALANSPSPEELINSRCMICHKLAPTHDELLAPPMRGIQMNYRNKYSTKEEFVAAIVSWVNQPDSIHSQMAGAIDNFGVMPDLNYSEEEVRIIAEYIYDADFPKPSWAGKGHGGGKGKMD